MNFYPFSSFPRDTKLVTNHFWKVPVIDFQLPHLITQSLFKMWIYFLIQPYGNNGRENLYLLSGISSLWSLRPTYLLQKCGRQRKFVTDTGTSSMICFKIIELCFSCQRLQCFHCQCLTACNSTWQLSHFIQNLMINNFKHS